MTTVTLPAMSWSDALTLASLYKVKVVGRVWKENALGGAYSYTFTGTHANIKKLYNYFN